VPSLPPRPAWSLFALLIILYFKGYTILAVTII
jgi:hypothetical protein